VPALLWCASLGVVDVTVLAMVSHATQNVKKNLTLVTDELNDDRKVGGAWSSGPPGRRPAGRPVPVTVALIDRPRRPGRLS